MGRGVAVHESFGSYAAQVAEVEVRDGAVRVRRVVCAFDCGIVVNPEIVTQQVEGAIVFGLTAALKGRITIRGGRVAESNFHDYPLLTMAEMPVIEVLLVPSGDAPGGVGEPATPPIGPAVANAVHAATGRRLRRLPLSLAG
jgi:isoquinoline 1-oxidoreductase beta subunit